MSTDRRKDWPNKAFRLAHFILGDREAARRAATNALARLEVASSAQFKRFYYTPTGRADSSRGASRSRVTVGDLQLLQRLVFAETENGERDREASGAAGADALLVHFVKHLVRIALKRNSFYVTLAVARVLHGYATSEALELYNVVVQDPGRVPDDYYCRSRKGLLMKELKARFEGLLATVKGARGEERFEAAAPTADAIATARACLREFTPWNSPCALPDAFDPLADELASFRFDKDDPDEEHRIEINRIHTLLHPDCFGRLTGVLNLPGSDEKMEIPGFMISNSTDRRDSDAGVGGPPPDLRDDELEEIERALRAHEESRRAFGAGALLRVVADGVEAARIDPETASAASFRLDDTAELIEVVGRGRDGADVLLAVHLLDYDAIERDGGTRAAFALASGRELKFDVRPLLGGDGLVESFDCRVEYAGANGFAAAWRRIAAGFGHFLVPGLAAAGLVLLVAGLGWLAWRSDGAGGDRIVAERPATPSSSSAAPTGVAVAPTPTEPPVPVKSPGAAPRVRRGETVVATPRRELRRPERKETARVEPVDDEGILRLPIYGSREGGAEPSRGGATGVRTKSLGEIRSVFIDVTGDRVIGGMLRETLAAELARRTRFRIVDSREQADAALKVFVRHESDGDEPEDRSATVIVRLVNVDGYVVYPSARRVSGWKYVGVAVRLARRVASDLGSAARR